MGITNLAKTIKASCGDKIKLSLLASEPPGRTVIALDMNNVLMQAICSLRGSQEYHIRPIIPANSVANTVLTCIKRAEEINITILPVFDGNSRHPSKEAVDGATRNRNGNLASEQLSRLLSTPVPTTPEGLHAIQDSIAKLRKQTSRIDNHVRAHVMSVLKQKSVYFLVAPFEADHQIAYMCNMGLVDGVISTDGDFWALINDPCVILAISWSKMEGSICVGGNHKFKNIDGVRSVHEIQKESKQHIITREYAILMACILGCDYYKGTPNVGIGRLATFVKESGGSFSNLLKEIIDKYPTVDGVYKRMHFIFNHAPVFELQPSITSTNVGDSREYNVTGNIVSMSGATFTSEYCKANLGWCPWELLDLPEGVNTLDIAEGKWFPAERISYNDSLPKHPCNNRNEELAFGAILDFNHCQLEYYALPDVIRWMTLRGYQPRMNMNIYPLCRKIISMPGVEP